MYLVALKWEVVFVDQFSVAWFVSLWRRVFWCCRGSTRRNSWLFKCDRRNSQGTSNPSSTKELVPILRSNLEVSHRRESKMDEENWVAAAAPLSLPHSKSSPKHDEAPYRERCAVITKRRSRNTWNTPRKYLRYSEPSCRELGSFGLFDPVMVPVKTERSETVVVLRNMAMNNGSTTTVVVE